MDYWGWLRINESSIIIHPDLCCIATLIVDEAHSQCFHQSTQITLALVCADYLVRRTVLRIVNLLDDASLHSGGLHSFITASTLSRLRNCLVFFLALHAGYTTLKSHHSGKRQEVSHSRSPCTNVASPVTSSSIPSTSLHSTWTFAL